MLGRSWLHDVEHRRKIFQHSQEAHDAGDFTVHPIALSPCKRRNAAGRPAGSICNAASALRPRVTTATPALVVARLAQVIAAEVKGPEVSRRLADMGMEPVGSTPEELGAVMQRDTQRWAKIVRDANIRLD